MLNSDNEKIYEYGINAGQHSAVNNYGFLCFFKAAKPEPKKTPGAKNHNELK